MENLILDRCGGDFAADFVGGDFATDLVASSTFKPPPPTKSTIPPRTHYKVNHPGSTIPRLFPMSSYMDLQTIRTTTRPYLRRIE